VPSFEIAWRAVLTSFAPFSELPHLRRRRRCSGSFHRFLDQARHVLAPPEGSARRPALMRLQLPIRMAPASVSAIVVHRPRVVGLEVLADAHPVVAVALSQPPFRLRDEHDALLVDRPRRAAYGTLGLDRLLQFPARGGQLHRLSRTRRDRRDGLLGSERMEHRPKCERRL